MQLPVKVTRERKMFIIFFLFFFFPCGMCNPIDTANKPLDQQTETIIIQPIPSSRFRLGRMLELFQKKRGAEIGVQKGQFSSHLLTEWTSCEYFLLVDPWKQQDETYTDSANVDNIQQEANYQETIRRLAFFHKILDIQRKTSKEATSSVRDNSLDFIFLDANHNYCSVKEDLELWWPKLRQGGFLTGHDFLDQDDVSRLSNFSVDWTICPDGMTQNRGLVKGAVLEFALSHNLNVFQIDDQGDPPSFLIEKIEKSEKYTSTKI